MHSVLVVQSALSQLFVVDLKLVLVEHMFLHHLYCKHSALVSTGEHTKSSSCTNAHIQFSSRRFYFDVRLM